MYFIHYSPHHVSKQGIRNIEKEILFALAWRCNGEWYCIRDFGYPRRAMWLATLTHGMYDGYVTQKMVGNWPEWLLYSVKNTEFLCFEVLNMRIIESEFIIIIFLHGLGRLTCSGIDALPSFPGASTVSSSSRFVVEGVFRGSGIVHSFKVVD